MTIIAKKDDSFVETTIDDEIVLMNIDTGNFHALKGTGVSIWRLVDGIRSIEDIACALEARYAVDHDACRADIRSFADRLVAAGLLVVR